ncbi:MAG: hypothetical protein GXZ08_09860 [Tissierellia bacterium]|nr:hypothetical protein [Tissierellia bacterium]
MASDRFILNPDGEKIKAVYYKSSNGDNILIYGEHLNAYNRTISNLDPLNHFLLIASIVILVMLIIYLIFRKNTIVTNIISKTILIPISYWISHFLLKGHRESGTLFEGEMLKILLLALVIYIIMVLGIKKYRKHKEIDETSSIAIF